MPRVALCSNSKHVWRAIRGDKFERCDVCGTFFPCKGARCGHGDCESARELGIEAWYKEWMSEGTKYKHASEGIADGLRPRDGIDDVD